MCSPTLIDAPVKPMLAMWCWPQPFGQPEILMWIWRVSGSSIARLSTRSASAALSPIELVIPSLQLSVPGQLTTSAIVRGPTPSRPSAPSARQTS